MSGNRPQQAAVALRDGRVVLLAVLDSGDAADVARLVDQTGDPRATFYAQAIERRADAAQPPASTGEFVARAAEGGQLVGYAAYLAGKGASGELAGVVEPHFAGLGLGTLLLRRAAENARRAGLKTLRVELPPGSDATAEMLRDAGLTSRWDLAYPVARVELALGTSRPGWSTPECRPLDEAAQ
jgi:GNAT superfamily N-acetyltransferase